MGNKERTRRERQRKDPRTKTTRRKRNVGALIKTSETVITTTTPNNVEEPASSSGPTNSCVLTASERKIRLSKDAVSLDASVDESTVALGTNDDDDNDEEEEEIIQNETECNAGHHVFMDTGILFPLE